jgi:hypothetical protein
MSRKIMDEKTFTVDVGSVLMQLGLMELRDVCNHSAYVLLARLLFTKTAIWMPIYIVQSELLHSCQLHKGARGRDYMISLTPWPSLPECLGSPSVVWNR